MKKIIFLHIFILGITCLIFTPGKSLAYKIEDLPNVKAEGDFVVGPGKTEVFLDPGQITTREISITNRTGRTAQFRVTVEDFKGTRTGETPLVLMGAEKGPYSLMDYLKPEVTEFTLNHGQKIILPLEINIPADSEPGGRYGAALISLVPLPLEPGAEPGEAKGQIRLVARVASLFFVKVKGPVDESGFLKAFRMADGKTIYEKGPFSFELLFENNGNIHLMPYGTVEIKNIFGKKIGEIEAEAWFAMPDSLRSRVLNFNVKWLFGRYTATAKINRGYQDIVDVKSISFWVLPWQIVVPIIVGIILLIAFCLWFVAKFEIRAKKKA